MNPVLKLLMEIQSLADEITHLRKRSDHIPVLIHDLNQHLERSRKNVESVTERIHNNESRIRKCESLIRDAKDQQGKYRAQLFKLKSNREYQALNSEITMLSEKISLYETEIIENMESSDSAKKQLLQAETYFRDEQERIVREKAILDAELVENLKGLQEAEKAYTEKRMVLPEEILAHYDKLIRKNGRAVAELTQKNCGNCYVKVQPQIAATVFGNSNLVNCDKCGVYLFGSETCG